MTWRIVADSTSDLHEGILCVPDTTFSIVPLKLRIGEQEFADDANVNVADVMDTLANHSGPSSTACPSPDEWVAEFMKADYTIAVVMTSALSGTYNSAIVAKEMVLESHPEKKIHIIDTKSACGQVVLVAKKVNQLIGMGLSFEEVCAAAEAYNKQTHLLFALASFNNLIKNGRMNKVVGMLATKLNMHAVGMASEKGELSVLHKTRGETRCITLLLNELEARKEPNRKHIVISHCQNAVGAKLLKMKIQEKWPDVEITILKTHAVSSYYAEQKGILIGF